MISTTYSEDEDICEIESRHYTKWEGVLDSIVK
jgi:hypothetical protein